MGTLRGLKKTIKSLLQGLGLFRSASSNQITNFQNLSYSQEGEDLILNRYFAGKENGFFVDIGAHHPKRFSNTYIFYLEGWRGLNIDALPGIKNIFDTERPEDINLELGVSEKEGDLIYYSFNEPALNTFDKAEADKKNGLQHYYIEKEIKIKTYPLSYILNKYLQNNVHIDFMSIDVEGFDLQVLKSNDWEKYKPSIILIEELRTDVEKIMRESEIYKYLTSKGYLLHFRTFNTSFYKLS
jgi:FkbM family methyltransferase